MAITSPEVKAALETIFAADSEFYPGAASSAASATARGRR